MENAGYLPSLNLVFSTRQQESKAMMQVFQSIDVDQYLTVYSVAAQRILEFLKRKKERKKQVRTRTYHQNIN